MVWLLAFFLIGLVAACSNHPARQAPPSPWDVSYDQCLNMLDDQRERTCLEALNARQQLMLGLTKAGEDPNLHKFYSTILANPDPDQDLLVPPLTQEESKPIILDADK